LHSLYYT